MTPMTLMTPEQAQAAILAGNTPHGIRVAGNLAFWSSSDLTHLPDDLHVDRLTLSGVGNLRALPRGLRCDTLIITDSGLTWLPEDPPGAHKTCPDAMPLHQNAAAWAGHSPSGDARL